MRSARFGAYPASARPARDRRCSPPLPANARPAPRAADSMATHATNERAMASALWEAASAGDTAETRRLLDEGAPVDRKNDADVSACCHGVAPPPFPRAWSAIPQDMRLSPASWAAAPRPARQDMWGGPERWGNDAVSWRAGRRWVAHERPRRSPTARAEFVGGTQPRRMALRRLLLLHPVATRTRWSCCWTGAPT